MTTLAAVVWASARSIVDVDATVFVQLGLFLLCFLLLRGLVFKPLLRLVDERRAQTLGMREEAKQLDSDADERNKKVLRALQQTKLEGQTERERMRQQSKQREQEILRTAKEEAARLQDTARAKVEAQRAEAERAGTEQARELAAGIAGRLAGRTL
jgi:F-type H+-transporting ATPase subunit b